MAAADRIFKNMTVFHDGLALLGECIDFTPPILAIQTEEFRAGGMDAAIELDMGMETLKASYTMAGVNPEVLKSLGKRVNVVFKGALDSRGEVTPYECKVTARVTGIDKGTITVGSVSPLTVSLTCEYYKESVGGSVIAEIDVVNSLRIINGVDQLATMRAAMGL
ncbi:hypothetical protein EDC56_1254 [Sinobacterium caligoides]|uniref:Phage tail tube protein FII n=1 Tax=Sinobacterium caligoides TaxID=933926 RepID=A0A3N2E2A2_9GAMM|nr:phage major tail tube protein [Sinobacterium caligoides]ROS05705.1 hypothetical protein EDC56_1254 [Sinobacterium caligoides]